MIPVPIRLYIVDPHPITRAGVSRLFRSEAAVLVVGGASNSLALLAGVVEACHVVVAEIATEQSIVDIETLLTHRPSVKVIAFTDCEGSAFVQRFARAGGVGYVSKSAPSLDGLFRAVLAAAAGHTPLDSRLAAALARPSMAVPLSARELEVLRRVAGGEAMTGIATALAVGGRTVETYRARGFLKLGMTTRMELVRHAVREGWFEEDQVPRTDTVNPMDVREVH